MAPVTSDVLFRDVEVEGRRSDVLVAGGVVTAVRPTGRTTAWAGSVDAVVHGGGGALLPGLHDHHLHLLSLAAELSSVRCGPPDVRDAGELADALTVADRALPAGRWLRATGYHESVRGRLDRHVLDVLVPGRPVRVQHRSGALWMLNTAALRLLKERLPAGDDTERGPDGEPTGLLWRSDHVLRGLGDDPPDLAEVGRLLTAYGLTGVTDATPDLEPGAVDLLVSAVASGDLRARVLLLGAAAPPGGRFAAGPLKLLLRDHDLPSFDWLADRVAASHDAGRPVAVHVLTRHSLLLTLAVLEQVGSLEGDRLEHAAVVPPEVRGRLAGLGVRVVTQPGFLRLRGEQYAEDVEPDDLPLLYPFASLVTAGVRTTASSDAPYGPLDPWRTIADAAARATERGRVLGPDERVTTATALSGYLSASDDPGGPSRKVRPGVPADLCLLAEPLHDALRHPHAGLVRHVVHGS